MKSVPYNTGKVKIGEYYVPPKDQRTITPEELRVQRALLNAPPDPLYKLKLWVYGVFLVFTITSLALSS